MAFETGDNRMTQPARNLDNPGPSHKLEKDMTTDERFEQIARNFQSVHDSLKSLETIAATHEERLDRIQADHARTEASIRAMADEVINTQREWRGYLRRIPRQ